MTTPHFPSCPLRELCVRVEVCVCVRSGRVCARLCIRLPGVLVKYSKIDLTPKALSASQSGREEDLFLVLLVPPRSCLSSSLCRCNFFIPPLRHPCPYRLLRTYYYSLVIRFLATVHFSLNCLKTPATAFVFFTSGVCAGLFSAEF